MSQNIQQIPNVPARMRLGTSPRTPTISISKIHSQGNDGMSVDERTRADQQCRDLRSPLSARPLLRKSDISTAGTLRTLQAISPRYLSEECRRHSHDHTHKSLQLRWWKLTVTVTALRPSALPAGQCFTNKGGRSRLPCSGGTRTGLVQNGFCLASPPSRLLVGA